LVGQIFEVEISMENEYRKIAGIGGRGDIARIGQMRIAS
jgi:hypothetical protein